MVFPPECRMRQRPFGLASGTADGEPLDLSAEHHRVDQLSLRVVQPKALAVVIQLKVESTVFAAVHDQKSVGLDHGVFGEHESARLGRVVRQAEASKAGGRGAVIEQFDPVPSIAAWPSEQFVDEHPG